MTILHAEHDHMAPIVASERLLADVRSSGKSNIKLVRFNDIGMGHIGISKHQDFSKVINEAVVEAHRYFESKRKL